MPRVIKMTEENEKLFNEILDLLFRENLNYEEVAKRLNKPKDLIYHLVRVYKKKYGIGRVISKYDYLCIKGDIEEVVKLYKDGVSTINIGKRYNVSERTVADWLRKQNVELRPSGKISKIDQTIFDNIDSEIKAYSLGLIMSDGNVTRDGNTISITLTKDDGYILELINEKLLSNMGNICEVHKEDKRPRQVLQFNGKHIKEALATYGVVPNKSHILYRLPDNIPEEFYYHFLRGLYDGDGVCSYYTSHKNRRVRIGYCAANKDFTAAYQDYFVKKLNMSRNKLFDTGGCWQCSWGKEQDLKNFFNYLYQDSTIYLGRKYKKLKDFVESLD